MAAVQRATVSPLFPPRLVGFCLGDIPSLRHLSTLLSSCSTCQCVVALLTCPRDEERRRGGERETRGTDRDTLRSASCTARICPKDLGKVLFLSFACAFCVLTVYCLLWNYLYLFELLLKLSFDIDLFLSSLPLGHPSLSLCAISGVFALPSGNDRNIHAAFFTALQSIRRFTTSRGGESRRRFAECAHQHGPTQGAHQRAEHSDKRDEDHLLLFHPNLRHGNGGRASGALGRCEMDVWTDSGPPF